MLLLVLKRSTWGGDREIRTYIVDDMVIVRLKGVLTKAELNLAKSDRNVRARELIKQVRIELIENGRSLVRGYD